MKKCTKCGIDKSVSEFNKDKNRVDGLFPWCRECKQKARKKHYEENKERIIAKTKEWHKSNPEKRKEICKRYRDNNKEKAREYRKHRRMENPEKYKKEYKKYYLKNRERILKSQKEYRDQYPERIREAQRKHYEINKESILKYHREFRKKYPERHKEHVRKWDEKNKERRKVITMNRIARIKNSKGQFTNEQWRDLKDQCGHTCLKCGAKEPGVRLSIDHVIPISKGGSNSIVNIQPLCLPCNQSKNIKTTDYRKGMISCLKTKSTIK